MEIRSLEPPTTAQYNNVYKWMKTNTPIDELESKTMLRKNDFVTTRKRQPNNRKGALEDYLRHWLVRAPKSGLSVRTSERDKKRMRITDSRCRDGFNGGSKERKKGRRLPTLLSTTSQISALPSWSGSSLQSSSLQQCCSQYSLSSFFSRREKLWFPL